MWLGCRVLFFHAKPKRNILQGSLSTNGALEITSIIGMESTGFPKKDARFLIIKNIPDSFNDDKAGKIM